MSRRAAQSGFSLVEVMISMVILGVVLLSIGSLLFVGQSNVLTGRRQTKAVAVAADAMEEFRQLGYHRTYRAFGDDGTTSSYDSGEIRVDGGSSGFAFVDPWLAELLEGVGPSATLQVRFEALDPTSIIGGTPPALQLSTLMRTEVVIRWDDRGLRREYRLRTVRT